MPQRFCNPFELDGPVTTNESVHAPVVPMPVTNFSKSSLSWQIDVFIGVTEYVQEPEVVYTLL